MIYVTKTHLPNKKKYLSYVDEIYKTGWITNNGPMVQKLELLLAKYLGVKHIVLVSNGTTALEIAYRTLGIQGSAITTPFSFVATTSSLVTNGIKPIYADIDINSFNIDSSKIQNLIREDTSAIVPVHVFGNACNVEALEDIAKQNNLKIIYDAAHAFNVMYKGKSLLNYGDISTLSFHATKLFHTIEGGALIINDDTLVQKARHLINFGIESPEVISHLGINAKMNEFQAAMGLCMLEEIEEVQRKRKIVSDIYFNKLNGLVSFQERNKDASSNSSYFPIIFKSELILKRIESLLNVQNIFPRRYFYPSLDTLKYIKTTQPCKISRDLSTRILCLPLYPDLDINIQMKIIHIIQEGLNE